MIDVVSSMSRAAVEELAHVRVQLGRRHLAVRRSR
jgi:hypothetical protein